MNITDDQRIFASMASITVLETYLVALAQPQSTERDELLGSIRDAWLASMRRAAEFCGEDGTPPYVLALLALTETPTEDRVLQ